MEEVGFSREQAETSIKVLFEVMESKLATKDDLKHLEHHIHQVESKLTIRLGAMIASAVVILTALNKLV